MSEGVTLAVKVVPGSSRDHVAGRYGEGIKVRVSAAPEKGRANAAVVAVLAAFFGVKPAQVRLVSAPANPRKQFRITGLSAEEVGRKCADLP